MKFALLTLYLWVGGNQYKPIKLQRTPERFYRVHIIHKQSGDTIRFLSDTYLIRPKKLCTI